MSGSARSRLAPQRLRRHTWRKRPTVLRGYRSARGASADTEHAGLDPSSSNRVYPVSVIEDASPGMRRWTDTGCCGVGAHDRISVDTGIRRGPGCDAGSGLDDSVSSWGYRAPRSSADTPVIVGPPLPRTRLHALARRSLTVVHHHVWRGWPSHSDNPGEANLSVRSIETRPGHRVGVQQEPNHEHDGHGSGRRRRPPPPPTAVGHCPCGRSPARQRRTRAGALKTSTAMASHHCICPRLVEPSGHR